MTADMDEVRRQLTARRHALGLSQRQLAAQLKVSNTQVCDAEKGRGWTTIGAVRRWAEALGCTARVVVDLPSTPADLEPEQWTQHAHWMTFRRADGVTAPNSVGAS